MSARFLGVGRLPVAVNADGRSDRAVCRAVSIGRRAGGILIDPTASKMETR